MFIKILLLIIFFGVMIGIGLYCRRNSTDVSGFVLGGRKVGPWLTAFAYGTSYFSAVVFVGYAGQFGWKYGIAATWAGIGNALIGSLLAWRILGRRTRIMTQHLDSATMPQFFGRRFDSKPLQIAASAITFIFLIPYTASLYNGLSRLFGMAFRIPYPVCVIAMAILTGIYVIAGGYMATAINDFIQGLIMIVGIIAVVLAVLRTQGGFLAALDALGQVTDAEVSATPGVFNSFFGPDPVNLLGVVLLTSLGTWGLPQMVQKFYAIRSEKAVETGLAEAYGSGRGRAYTLSHRMYQEQASELGYLRQKDIEEARFFELTLNLARGRDFISRKDVVELLHVKESKAYSILKALADRGDLTAINKGRYAKYQYNPAKGEDKPGQQ